MDTSIQQHASEDIMMMDEGMGGEGSFFEDDYKPEEIATRVMLMEPSPEDEDEDSEVDVDYNPMEDEEMDDDEDEDDALSADECDDLNIAEENAALAPSTSQKGVPPIDYEGILKAYNTGSHVDEEEAEFSDGEGDDSSSASSDELDETHDAVSVGTAVMLQEPDEDEDEDVDDRAFSPKKRNIGVVVVDQDVLKAQVEQITASTDRM